MPEPQTIPAGPTASPARLLVVDDNEMNRDMLSRRLTKAGYRVAVADDGAKALDLILPFAADPASVPFDLVLLDVMMPGIDGFEVLRRLREVLPATSLPIIMATAKDQRDEIVRAFDLGANDYATKPIDFAVVHARIRTQLELKAGVDRILALERSLTDRNSQLQHANQRMRAELEMAAKVQQALLPAAIPSKDAVDFAWAYKPCEELGGDILGILDLDDSAVGIYLLDVSGHGVPAALLSVTLSRVLACSRGAESLTLRRRADGSGLEPTPPIDLVHELNRRFPMDPSTLQYFTLFYGLLDTRSGLLRFVSAGHPPPIHHPRGESPRPLHAADHAVGWFPESSFTQHTVTLNPGDRFFLYSDGISEAAGPAGRAFGLPGILAAIERSHADPIQASLENIVGLAASASGAPFKDDVSAVAIAFRP